jgi:hypothetical protein
MALCGSISDSSGHSEIEASLAARIRGGRLPSPRATWHGEFSASVFHTDQKSLKNKKIKGLSLNKKAKGLSLNKKALHGFFRHLNLHPCACDA